MFHFGRFLCPFFTNGLNFYTRTTGGVQFLGLLVFMLETPVIPPGIRLMAAPEWTSATFHCGFRLFAIEAVSVLEVLTDVLMNVSG
uniref:Uncharacterized protein n=1 Tax=Oryzias sinensis TaxID=183150 RepID=A0A8C7YF18_9TELE